MGFGCYDAYKEQNFIWFSAIDHNGLYKLNIDNNEMVKLAEFSEEDNIFDLHRKIIVYNRTLYFIPLKGKGISKYHLDTHEMEYFIPDDRNEIHASNAFLDNNVIWILPRNLSQPLYEFNIVHKKFHQHKEWNEKILKLYGLENNHILSLASSCFADKTMMTVISNTPYVIKTSMQTWKIETYCISNKYRLRGIAYDSGNYWITLSKGGSILYVDINGKKINMIDLDTSSNAAFMNIIADDQSVIILPSKDTKIYRIDKKLNQSYIYDIDMRQNLAKKHLSWCMGWLKDEDGLYILPCAGDEIEKYDINKEKQVDFILKDVQYQSFSVSESEEHSLTHFLETIDSYQCIVKSNYKINSYGKMIWKAIEQLYE